MAANLAGHDDAAFLELTARDIERYDPTELMAIMVRCQDRVETWTRLGRAVMMELAVRWPGVVREIETRTGTRREHASHE